MERRSRWAMLVVALAAVGAVGCGGAATATEAKTPGAAPAADLPPGAAVPIGPGGQQMAISDAPTSGENAAPRPKMNAAAAQAYAAGMSAFQSGDLNGAKNQFAKATKSDKNAYQAFYSLGVVAERLHDTSAAQAAYRRAVSIVPDYEPAIVAYAVSVARTGKPADAESFLDEKMARMPKSAAVAAALAEVKSIQGDSGEAQRYAQEALKRNPDYRPAMVTLARDHYRSRRLDLALYALKGILDGYGEENPPRDKDNASAHLLRGLIYKEQGNRQGAITELREAVRLRPDLVEARVHLATYLLESGNAAEAADILGGALRYDRTNLMAHLNLGDAYRLLGKPAEARQELEWVLSKDSTVAQAHYNLGLLYLFSDSIPGVSKVQASDKAVEQFTLYKQKHQRSQGEAPDDTEELITRAKTKKAILQAEAAEKNPPPPADAGGDAAAAPEAAKGGEQ